MHGGGRGVSEFVCVCVCVGCARVLTALLVVILLAVAGQTSGYEHMKINAHDRVILRRLILTRYFDKDDYDGSDKRDSTSFCQLRFALGFYYC